MSDRPDEVRLAAACERFVVPFYLEMLHANCLKLDDPGRTQFGGAVRDAAGELDVSTAALLLRGPSWREHLAVAWYIGLNGWHQFVDELGTELVASALVYQGQGFALSLALLATDESAEYLERYLEHWLKREDRIYDQGWVLAALMQIDRERGTARADSFLGENGPWERWRLATGLGSLAPIQDLVSLVRSPAQ